MWPRAGRPCTGSRSRSRRPARPGRCGRRPRSRCCARPRRRWPTWPSTRRRAGSALTLSYMDHEVALDVRDDGQGLRAPPSSACPGLDAEAARPAEQRIGRPAGRVRAGRDAAADRGPGGNAADRIGAGRRHRDLGLHPGAPDVRPQRRRPAGARHRRVEAVPIRLLIADDHPVVSDGLSGMFARDPGFEVVGEAADGAEAVRLAAALRPDVILMDLRMPGMDGVTAITELARRGIAARVLVLTTYDTDSHVLPAIEAGATGYLLKDAPRAELLRAVRAAAHGEAVLSPSVATRLMSRVRAPRRRAAQPARARGPGTGRGRAPPTGRRPPGCSSARPRSRPTCCTSTPSSASATAPPPWPRRSTAACSPADHEPHRPSTTVTPATDSQADWCSAAVPRSPGGTSG